MKKVLVGGTFNIIHPGHLLFLEKAKEKGDYLVVVVANDKTVLREKGFLVMPAEARKKVLESLKPVNKAVVGDEKDFLKVVREERPEIIALGYDQKGQKEIQSQLRILGLKCSVVRIRSRLEAYKTEKVIAKSAAKLKGREKR